MPKSDKKEAENKQIGLGELLAEQKAQLVKMYNEIHQQREVIVEAFMAETGLKPSECEQVIQTSEKETIWFIRMRS